MGGGGRSQRNQHNFNHFVVLKPFPLPLFFSVSNGFENLLSQDVYTKLIAAKMSFKSRSKAGRVSRFSRCSSSFQEAEKKNFQRNAYILDNFYLL